MTVQGFDEAVFAELFVVGVVGFGDAVGVEGEGVPWMELAFSNFAIPILEDTQHGGSGLEARDGIVAAEHKSGEMAAIRIARAAGGVVVFGEEESGEGAGGCVVVEGVVDGD